MTLLQQLLKLKGLSELELARTLRVPYHCLQKTIKPTAWYTKDGRKKYREYRHIRKKIAAWLGCPYESLWGPNSAFFLKRLIKEEHERQAEQIQHEMETEDPEQLQALTLL